jgi:hypothetical protein
MAWGHRDAASIGRADLIFIRDRIPPIDPHRHRDPRRRFRRIHAADNIGAADRIGRQQCTR